MIYRRRRIRHTAPSGHFRFESLHNRCLNGYSDGEFIQLKDEYGHVWRGSAEVQDQQTIRYRFRDHEGNTICGISDRFGVMLRDERGNCWRGYVC